ncbi:MAG TPA: glycosyltransferase [Algoriphagus sp.]|nr:glycosyltransferase [Algoriphagus sp.]
MLSIVISSANAEYLAGLKSNISETIGCPYEILAYPNERGARGICEVYNQGIEDAAYGIVCFMHEDIRILTPNWGEVVFRNFSENPSLGLLGVAGGDYKSLAPSSWFNFEARSDFPGKKYINLIQGFQDKSKEPIHELNNPRGQKLSKVACVDGVWMCTRKSIAQEIKFDEKLLKGFHGYDIDYSISVGQKHDVAVTFEVLMHHFSEGKSTKGWVEAQIAVHKKWSHLLPINLTGASLTQCMSHEKHFFRNFLNYAKSLGIPESGLKQIITSAKASPALGLVLYLKLQWFIHKISLKKH